MRPPPNVVNAAVKEGHSNFVLSDDAIPQQCSVDNGRDRNNFPNSNSPTPPPSRRYERCERNRGLLRQLSYRFGFRSNDDLNDSAANDDDNQSSSTESCSSSQATTTTTSAKGRERPQQQQQQLQQQQCMDNMLVSGTSSETSSTIEDIEEAVSITQQQQQQQNGQYENDENDSQMGEEEEEEDQEQDENAKQQQQEAHHHNNNGRRFNSRASFSRLQRRSTSTIRRALESFSLTTRSLSCSGATPPLQSQQSDSECNTPKSSNNSTPIKSSLKCSSNLELHKKTSNTTLIAVNHQQQQHHYSFSAASSAHGPNHTHNNCNVIRTAKQTKTKQPPQRILRQPVSYTYLKGISGLPTQRVPRNSVCCQYARR